MIISFTNPNYLFLLAVIPVIILIHFISLKQKRGVALRFANFDAISRIRGIDLYSKNILILTLTIIICFLLVFSISGLTIQRVMSASTFSFVIAIDSSRSMEANDFLPNRMEVAKNSAIGFVDSSPAGTKFAVISFSGNSFIEESITQDKFFVKKAINNIEVSPVGGTDLYEAILTSTNLLSSEEYGSVILLSDGQINIGELNDAIDYANENNLILHSIAIGTEKGGETAYGLSKVDENSLKAVAYNTGGKFFSAESNEEISDSFNEILNLGEKKVSFNLSNYLVLSVIILVILEFFLINTRYRIFP